jgi:uncharacterized protein YjiS (DUF1127 family)
MDDAFDSLVPLRSNARTRFGGTVVAVFRLLRRCRARARRRNELVGLSPYLLDDLGITAVEAQRESERQPWEAPMLRSSTPTQPREDR